jgi:hypothetical protein
MARGSTSALGSLPKSGFPTACAGVFSSGAFTGEGKMRWQDIENDREKYAAYLCSREWAEKREAVRKRADDRCERCRALPMDSCHHLTYERKYAERLDDLQAICRPCHQFTHGKHDFDPRECDTWLRYLMYCKGAGKKVIDEVITYDVLTQFADSAKLLAIEAIYRRHREIYEAIWEFTDDQEPSAKAQRVLRELERLPEVVESCLGIDYAYAAWLRFRKPRPPIRWFNHALEIVGVEGSKVRYWPEEQ